MLIIKNKPVSKKQNQFQQNKPVSKNQTDLNIEPQHMFPAIELSIKKNCSTVLMIQAWNT